MSLDAPISRSADAPILEAKALAAGYAPGRDVVADLDLRVPAGGAAALLGANGAGKTTVLRALSGLIRRRGAIVFDGRRIETRAPEAIARLGVAHAPEGRGAFARFTVAENLRLGAMGRHGGGLGLGGSGRAARAAMAEDQARALALFPRLAERLDQRAGRLSGGEQQMLAIARAMMSRPKLLLLDEPSFGLAPKMVAALYEALAELRRRDRVAMLIVEQNAQAALALADTAYVLETGRMAFSGAAADLARDDRVRRAYLG